MDVRGEEPVALGPGQTFYESPNDIHTIGRNPSKFYESPNDIHTIGRNPSKTTLIKFLVFLIKGKVAPVSIPVE